MATGRNAASSALDEDFDLDFTRVLRVVVPSVTPAPVARADAPVLVVEDHEGSRKLLAKMLSLMGLPVRVCADNREFARELRQPPLPRLILLDVGLPRVDGFQILSHLRAHPQTGAIPVVMVTGHSDQKDVIRGLMLGADGYISKPVSVTALRSVIETVLWKQ